jgi:hypothetical protein
MRPENADEEEEKEGVGGDDDEEEEEAEEEEPSSMSTTTMSNLPTPFLSSPMYSPAARKSPSSCFDSFTCSCLAS